MSSIEICLDGEIFSVEAVVRATHRYSADYFAEIASTETGVITRLIPKSVDTDTSALVQQFRNDVLDEQLRERIRADTKGLQEILVRAALLKTDVPPSS